MAAFKRFEDIIAWQKARLLNQVLSSYIKAGKFQRDYKLISQMEDSAGSVMDNIAEGFERGGNKEFRHFLFVSKGSCGEFRSQCYRAFDRGYLNQDDFNTVFGLAKEIIVMEQKLLDYLLTTEMKGIKFISKSQPNT